MGLADRAAFDLTAHSKMSKSEMTAHEAFAEPRMVDTLKARGKRGGGRLRARAYGWLRAHACGPLSVCVLKHASSGSAPPYPLISAPAAPAP